MCVYIPCNFHNQIRNIIRETKRRNPAWIVSHKDKNTKWHYSHNICLFLFLFVYSKFGFKNSRQCKHTPCEQPQIYFKFICHLKIWILWSGIMVSCEVWYHLIFSRRGNHTVLGSPSSLQFPDCFHGSTCGTARRLLCHADTGSTNLELAGVTRIDRFC